MTTADALKAQEAFNFALFQFNPEPIVVVDRDGCVLKSNLARRALDEPLPALGKPLFETGAGDGHAALAAGLADCIRDADVKRFPEVELGRRWWAITMAPFPEGAVVITEDVTARKRAEADAEEQRGQLIHADKMIALGTLVAGVAHEISNPNNAMLLSASALRRLCDDLIPVLDRYRELEGEFEVGGRDYSEIRTELPELVNVATCAAKRIKSFVGDLKAFARKGPDTLDETVNLNAVVDAAANLVAALIRNSTYHFSIERDETLPPIRGNAQRIEQVVINLLTNACQALPGPDRAIAVTTGHDRATGEVILEVRDEGTGIAPEHLERIMDPFFTTRHDSGGTGLGLSISNTIVRVHGGQLAFTSEPGRGTIAVIRLPGVRPPTEPPNDAVKGAPAYE